MTEIVKLTADFNKESVKKAYFDFADELQEKSNMVGDKVETCYYIEVKNSQGTVQHYKYDVEKDSPAQLKVDEYDVIICYPDIVEETLETTVEESLPEIEVASISYDDPVIAVEDSELELLRAENEMLKAENELLKNSTDELLLDYVNKCKKILNKLNELNEEAKSVR